MLGEESGATFELQLPVELVEPIATLLPGLVAKGALRLEVFSYGRPGKTPYWLAFVFDNDGRHVVGTPESRSLPLEEQHSDLIQQLANWAPSLRSTSFS